MPFLIYTTLLSAIFAPFLVAEGVLPGLAKYTPEFAAGIIAAFVLASIAREPEKFSRGSYLLIFSFLVLFVGFGVIVNSVAEGPLFAGMRYYLRALPLFLLPFFFPLSERTLKTLFWILVSAAVIQLPLAFEQRAQTSFRGWATGDLTVGSLGLSPYLSLFQICVMTLLLAAYVKRLIKGPPVLLLLGAILLPPMINETKASFLLVPLALALTLIIGSRPGQRLQGSILAVALIVLFGVLFIQIYDYYMAPRWGYGFIDFLTMEGRVENYLNKEASLGSTQVGIIDGVIVPLYHMHGDPVRWAFGYGFGNVSDSALGPQFTGAHYQQFASLVGSSFGVFLLELGVPVLIMLASAAILVFFDGLHVADSRKGYSAAFSLATSTMCVVLGVGFVYKDIFASSALVFLIALCAGHVASCRSIREFAASADVTRQTPLSHAAVIPSRGGMNRP